MQHATRRGDKPNQRKEDRERCNDNGVDLPRQWTTPSVAPLEKVGHDAEDDGSRDKLAEAKEDGDGAGEYHFDEWCSLFEVRVQSRGRSLKR